MTFFTVRDVVTRVMGKRMLTLSRRVLHILSKLKSVASIEDVLNCIFFLFFSNIVWKNWSKSKNPSVGEEVICSWLTPNRGSICCMRSEEVCPCLRGVPLSIAHFRFSYKIEVNFFFLSRSHLWKFLVLFERSNWEKEMFIRKNVKWSNEPRNWKIWELWKSSFEACIFFLYSAMTNNEFDFVSRRRNQKVFCGGGREEKEDWNEEFVR